jgi:hypothetical protein
MWLIYKDFAPSGAANQSAMSKNRDAPTRRMAGFCRLTACLEAWLITTRELGHLKESGCQA